MRSYTSPRIICSRARVWGSVAICCCRRSRPAANGIDLGISGRPIFFGSAPVNSDISRRAVSRVVCTSFSARCRSASAMSRSCASCQVKAVAMATAAVVTVTQAQRRRSSLAVR